jgi:hypothetical protein
MRFPGPDPDPDFLRTKLVFVFSLAMLPIITLIFIKGLQTRNPDAYPDPQKFIKCI